MIRNMIKLNDNTEGQTMGKATYRNLRDEALLSARQILLLEKIKVEYEEHIEQEHEHEQYSQQLIYKLSVENCNLWKENKKLKEALENKENI